MSVDLPASSSEVEALLTSAVKSRASYIRNESGSMTLADARRLLEKDLGLEKFQLDPQKALIRKLVDEVLLATDGSEASSQEAKEESVNEEQGVHDSDERSIEDKVSDKKQQKKVSLKKMRQEEEAGEDEEDQISGDSQERHLHVEAPKKKKRKEGKGKVGRTVSKMEEELSEEGGGNHPEISDDKSDLSEGKKPHKGQVKKSADVKSAYNKQVEHLKKIIKACGLNVPPSIYKKVKQVSDSKRDAFLIKELEGILSRQGLSSNPTDKEIKAVKRRIDREKDLEGIDTTNIIMEPRGRRAAGGFFAPPIYTAPAVEHDSEENEDDASSSKEGDAEILSGAEEGSDE